MFKTLVVLGDGNFKISVGSEFMDGRVVSKIIECEDERGANSYVLQDADGKNICQFTGGSYMGVFK